MKNMKQILMIIILLFNICACKKNANSNSNDMPRMSQKEIMLLKKIKDRTEKDLKKLGIKKVLTTGDGWWFDGVTISYQFNLDGKIYIKDRGNKCGFWQWKVENGKLFINPINNRCGFSNNKLYEMIIEACEPAAYSPDYLNRYKYSVRISSIGTGGFEFTITK